MLKSTDTSSTHHFDSEMNTAQRSDIIPINEPRAFDIGEVFFSTTDAKGRILAGNDVFVRISGYSYRDLVGAPHNIIRHPDMPRVVFKLLWQYLESGRTIAAYVKNMAKDGRYYWVVALVTPIVNGYLSVRFKPSSPLLGTVAGLYTELAALERKIEAEPGGSRQKGMVASQNLLVEKLASLGFADYDTFMRVAMLTEIRERNKALKKNGPRAPKGTPLKASESSTAVLSQSCATVGHAVDVLFDHMDNMTSVENVIGSTDRFISDSAHAMKILCLNAMIESTRLGDSARAISIVADWLNSSLASALSETDILSRIFARVLTDMRIALFELACAKLQVEVMHSFARSLGGTGAEKRVASHEETVRLVQMLCKSMSEQMSHAFKVLSILPETSSSLIKGVELINKQQRTLRFLHVAGNVEIARLPDQTTLKNVFDEVAGLIGRTNDELVSLQDAVGAMKNVMERSAAHRTAAALAVGNVAELSGSLA